MGSVSEKTNQFFAFTESVGELIILNFWTILCCIPIVTIGASIAAMHDVLIRKKRNEPYTITGSFFRAFKNNFRHATGTWLVFAGIFLFLLWDYELLNQAADRIPGFVEIIVLALMFICVAALQWAFVLVARYSISVRTTIGYAFTRIIAFPIRTLLLLAVTLIPLYLIVYYPITTPIMLFLGLALVARVQSGIYDRALHVMEDDE
jgi:uncharacterized membrane protein YesL